MVDERLEPQHDEPKPNYAEPKSDTMRWRIVEARPWQRQQPAHRQCGSDGCNE
jgi:hypothetical protein